MQHETGTNCSTNAEVRGPLCEAAAPWASSLRADHRPCRWSPHPLGSEALRAFMPAIKKRYFPAL